MKNKIMKLILPIISVVLAFIIGGIVIACINKSPMEAYGYLFNGALGSKASIGETFVKMIPLAFTGLCAAFAYSCGVFNLGGEGQFIMGAVAACWFSTTFSDLNPVLIRIVSLIIGAMAGCIWGAIPGLLKAYKNLNEMITSIFFNYIATLFMEYLYSGPMKEAKILQTAAVPDAARLTKIWDVSRLHAGFYIVIILAVLLFYFMYYTSKGYKLRAVGLNPTAARVNGIPLKSSMLIAFLVSGAIAGLGGAVELFGVSFRLQPGLGEGFGFDGVAVALIGQLNPIGTLISSFGFAVLKNGANYMQVGSKIPTAVADIIQALVILFVIVATAVTNLPAIKDFFAGHKKYKEASNE